MTKTTPRLSEAHGQEALNLLLDPKYKDLLKRIDHDYLFWDKVKYMAPNGTKPEALWYAVKIRRSINPIRIQFGKYQFCINITAKMQELLHEFDMNFGGNIGTNSIIPEKDSVTYLVSSIMEEAIASSKMEGASTTRKAAKEMLRKQSRPINKSQQMILNNYNTIKYLVEHKEQPFSINALKEIHRSITNNTLGSAEDEGEFRKDNSIYVMNGITGEVAHTPPDVSELEDLQTGLCEFANEATSDPFIHPIVKGIVIHFMLAFFHPFVDGNGRTARSLVYWYLLKNGYWMTEYLSISRIIYKSKSQYEKSFIYTEKDGLDLSYFINYNLNAMKKAYEELKSYLQKKIKEQQDFYTFLSFSDINDRQAQIIQILNEQPSAFFTVKELTTRFGITPKTARSDLQHLTRIGLMTESPINKRAIGYIRSKNFTAILKDLDNH
ncbi:MAG: Fic family protein [Bacteroidales bacterium]|nr:Fic family protein [Bacteroidales bacterium]